MITEDYVSFDIAKLLKEKGFIIPYDSFRGVYINGVFKRLNPGAAYGFNDGDEIVDVCSLQLAMKWLREVHNIALNVCYLFGNWYYLVYRTDVSSSGVNSEDFDTYEEACENAIRYCLENLI